MNSQTDNLEVLADLDFDIPCQGRWRRPDGTGYQCDQTATLYASFISWHEIPSSGFACQVCVQKLEEQGRLLDVQPL